MRLILLVLILFITACVKKRDYSITYSYGPSIVFNDGLYYMYFCSSGVDGGWDSIRLSTSIDGKVWSNPRVILTSNKIERTVCDPSVVKFKDYYYLFYSGNVKNIQTLNYVSRSRNLTGPFQKLGEPIIYPFHPSNDGPGAHYGAGQPTVINKNEMLYQWYTDDTENGTHIYLTQSQDAINWSSPIQTNVTTQSVDIKYTDNKFVMILIELEHTPNAKLVYKTSLNGIIWSDSIILSDIPAWSNNVGISGDVYGKLLNLSIIGYGAPYDLNPNYNNDCSISPPPYCWGYWELFTFDLLFNP